MQNFLNFVQRPLFSLSSYIFLYELYRYGLQTFTLLCLFRENLIHHFSTYQAIKFITKTPRNFHYEIGQQQYITVLKSPFDIFQINNTPIALNSKPFKFIDGLSRILQKMFCLVRLFAKKKWMVYSTRVITYSLLNCTVFSIFFKRLT